MLTRHNRGGGAVRRLPPIISVLGGNFARPSGPRSDLGASGQLAAGRAANGGRKLRGVAHMTKIGDDPCRPLPIALSRQVPRPTPEVRIDCWGSFTDLRRREGRAATRPRVNGHCLNWHAWVEPFRVRQDVCSRSPNLSPTCQKASLSPFPLARLSFAAVCQRKARQPAGRIASKARFCASGAYSSTTVHVALNPLNSSLPPQGSACPSCRRSVGTRGSFAVSPRFIIVQPLALVQDPESGLEIVLRHGPVERHALARPFLQRVAISRDRLLQPRRAALALAKAP